MGMLDRESKARLETVSDCIHIARLYLSEEEMRDKGKAATYLTTDDIINIYNQIYNVCNPKQTSLRKVILFDHEIALCQKLYKASEDETIGFLLDAVLSNIEKIISDTNEDYYAPHNFETDLFYYIIATSVTRKRDHIIHNGRIRRFETLTGRDFDYMKTANFITHFDYSNNNIISDTDTEKSANTKDPDYTNIEEYAA